jgi:hypothetical protein
MGDAIRDIHSLLRTRSRASPPVGFFMFTTLRTFPVNPRRERSGNCVSVTEVSGSVTLALYVFSFRYSLIRLVNSLTAGH